VTGVQPCALPIYEIGVPDDPEFRSAVNPTQDTLPRQTETPDRLALRFHQLSRVASGPIALAVPELDVDSGGAQSCVDGRPAPESRPLGRPGPPRQRGPQSVGGHWPSARTTERGWRPDARARRTSS